MTQKVVTDKTLGSVKRYGYSQLSYDPDTELLVDVEDGEVLPHGVEKYYVKVVSEKFVEMTQGEKDLVDAARLPEIKRLKFLEVDARTEEIIAQGFEFPPSSGVKISMSVEQQSRIMGMYTLRNDPNLIYPISWNSLDDTTELTLSNASEVEAFYLTGVGTLRAILDSGTAVKDQIRLCTTKACVDAIVDPR